MGRVTELLEELPWEMPEQEETYLRSRARFCLATGRSPAEYDAMTHLEISIWVEEHNDLRKE